jgi:putative phosphoribosyl transferase
LFDLLTDEEAKDRRNVFDISLLSVRVGQALSWSQQQSSLDRLPIGLFGASTGAGAAILAAVSSPFVSAIVSRGGRPDLSGPALSELRVPTLLIVGGADRDVLVLNEEAARQMRCPHKIIVVPGAGHLFEEPGALEHVLAISGAWFLKHMRASVRADLPFRSRVEAGERLGVILADHRFEKPVVYALPRGGVPLAIEISKCLDAPLDVILVRKIGVPGQPELAAASVTDGEQADIVMNEDVMKAVQLGEDDVRRLAVRELQEIHRQKKLYRLERAPVTAKARTAILVDDGVATGTTMRAAILGIRKQEPARVVLAVPVASRDAMSMLGHLVDDAIALAVPDRFGSVGQYYKNFNQLTDDDVTQMLRRYAEEAGA